MISNNCIDKVRDIDIVQVISPYITDLKKVGSNYKAFTPFGNEKTPSFTVNQQKQFFYCFSTGIGGDAISFVMEKKQCPFMDAVTTIAKDHGITIEYDSEVTEEQRAQKADYLKLNQAVLRSYQKQLLDAGNNAIEFLFGGSFNSIREGKSFTLESVLQWQLGYAPNSWDFITKKCERSNTVEEAAELGILSKKGSKTFDFLRERIVFPIHNHLGQLVAFGGRNIGHVSESPKYINSPQSSLYDKSQVLYGLWQSAQAIRTKGYVILTEGYTDVISCHQYGLNNTVASCGTALQKGHATLLKKYTNKVTVMYDGDVAGHKASLRSINILAQEGLLVSICQLPGGHDPDSFVRSHPNAIEYLRNKSIDGVQYLTNKLQSEVDDPITRSNNFQIIANTISKYDQPVIREDYAKWVARNYDLSKSVMTKLVDEAVKKGKVTSNGHKNGAKKNRVIELDNPTVYPFFEEKFDDNDALKEIKINRFRFVQLLGSFGYTRHEINNDATTFVRIKDNVIKHTHKDEIIDHFEKFLRTEYDFDGAGCTAVDYESLINKFYSGLGSFFSKDLFNRVRTEQQIVFNQDGQDTIYLYYRNGFVRITGDGYKLLDYAAMEGSVWEDQLLERDFKIAEVAGLKFADSEAKKPRKEIEGGIFADFVFRIANEDLERFQSLCSIIGYLMHDYYDYKLKAVNLTDSSLSDEADGRSGKTMLCKIIGWVRSYCEINGKNFNAADKNKYEDAKPGTQFLHINDVRSKGVNKFDFEDIFNDVTEGIIVNQKYMKPFRHRAKMAISSNNPINIVGGSQRDRVIEFELSGYFSADHSPEQEYGSWFGRDWDEKEWSKFDNFMCYCGQTFLKHGILKPGTINLEERKLIKFTSHEFLEFIREVDSNLKSSGYPFVGYIGNTDHASPIPNGIIDFEFDKKKFYEKFTEFYSDYNNHRWFTQNLFTKWLKLYAELHLGIKQPQQRRSDGKSMFLFKEESTLNLFSKKE